MKSTRQKNNWQEVNLGSTVSKIIDNRGKTPPTVSHGRELLEVNAITDASKQPNYSNVRKYVTEDVYQNWFRAGHPEANDILVPTVGTIGNVAILKENRGAIAQNLVALRINNENSSDFLYYLLKSPLGRSSVMSLDIGGVQPSVKVPHLLNMEILIPPLLIQKTIAEVLSSLDDKIDLLRRQNKTLEDMAQTLFRKWFIDETDEGWEELKLGDFIQPKKGKNITKADVVFGDVPVIAGGFEPSCYHNKANTRAPVITISASGANAGYVKLHHVPVWSSDSSFVDETVSEYVYAWYIFLKLNQDILFDKQEGSAQPHIYPKHIMDIPLLNFPAKKVAQFEKNITHYFLKISHNLSQMRTLEKLRDTSLPKLMSGAVRIKN